MKSFITVFCFSMLFLAATFTTSFAQADWQRSGDPVLDLGPSGAWDEGFVATPSVLFDGNIYHMWYWGEASSTTRYIGYATSPDGISWTKYNDTNTTSPPFAESDPVLDLGESGLWDDGSIATPSVIILDNTYHMWYAGGPDPTLFGPISIGHAISNDGINWEKKIGANPVLAPGTAGTWDDAWLFSPCVLFDGDIYHMWYSAWNGTGEQVRIGHATSPHPDSTWTKDPNNPVLSYGSFGNWDYPRADGPNVIYDGTTFHMWYSGGEWFKWRIGYATSLDGSTWTKDDDSNPVLGWGESGRWDNQHVGNCSVLLDTTGENDVYKMWYTGGNGDWDGHIGYVTSPDGRIWNDIIDDITAELPGKFVLSQNYPNPFNPTTNIEFSIPKTGFVTLKIYNLLGKEVATLVSKKLTTGNYKQTWDASGFASGLYFYRLETGKGFVQTKKLILLK